MELSAIASVLYYERVHSSVPAWLLCCAPLHRRAMQTASAPTLRLLRHWGVQKQSLCIKMITTERTPVAPSFQKRAGLFELGARPCEYVQRALLTSHASPDASFFTNFIRTHLQSAHDALVALRCVSYLLLFLQIQSSAALHAV